jgi:hypothetical protein
VVKVSEERNRWVENNYYFETLKKFLGEMDEESITKRLGECESVLGELGQSQVWKIVLSDAREMVKKLDESWQDFPSDSPQLKEARVLKMATKHIIDLPIKYAQELQAAQEELAKRQNPEEIIQKDVDNA